jgi:hypothetical protein
MQRVDRLGLPRGLGNGLVLRWARPDDVDALVEFNRLVFAEPNGEPDEVAGIQARELMLSTHPTASPADHVVVEEVSTGKIVSSSCLIPQTWNYGGIPFGVARPELVGTDSAYRNQGLVRAEFEALHALSAERGDLVQAITGIPFFYRKFGYDTSLITEGGQYGTAIAAKSADEPSYKLRRATETDIPTIMACYEIAKSRKLLTAERDESIWRWELTGRLTGSDYVHVLWIIEGADGRAAGMLAHQEVLDWRRPILWATMCELLDGESWPLAAPIVLEHLRIEAEKLAEKEGLGASNVGFDWGSDHPFVQLNPRTFQASVRPFSWWIRISNLAKFLRHIKPVLKQRLRESMFHRHSGGLVLTFYTSAVKIVIENGDVTSIEDFMPDSYRDAAGAFPDATFLQLLLGCRTIEELEYAYPDSGVRKEIDRALVTTLFPKLPSTIWPV